MRLTVKDDYTREVLEGITLEDGWRPCLDIRMFSPSEEEIFVIPQIQVAVWFKTLVLASVTIDCEEKCVTWSTRSCEVQVTGSVDALEDGVMDSRSESGEVEKDSSHQLTKWSLMVTRDRHHTDELGDLFEITGKCLEDYTSSKNRVAFFERMLKVLHCFILPSITLSQKDTVYLQAALGMQRALIKRQDELVNNAMVKVTELQKIMQDFRAQMLNDIIMAHSCSRDKKVIKSVKVSWMFIQQLWLDLGHDANKLSRDITAAQSDQDVIAKQIKDVLPTPEESFEQRVGRSFTQKTLKTNDMVHLTELFQMNAGLLRPKLQRALKIKDDTIAKYEAITTAMEILHKDLEKMKGSKPHTKFTVLREKSKCFKAEVVRYLEDYYQLRKYRDGIMSLLNTKVQLISVREAILSCLHSLANKDKTTFGVEYSIDGQGATDVLVEEVTIIGSWKTLEEEVMSLLDQTKSAVSQKHFTFLAHVLFQCDIIETKLRLQDSRDSGVGASGRTMENRSYKEGHVIVDHRDLSGSVNNISSCIQNHVIEMINDLQASLTLDRNYNIDKLRICYERLLFNKIATSVTAVYDLAFKDEMTQIKTNLPQVTVQLLELENSSVVALLSTTNGRKKCSHDDSGEAHDQNDDMKSSYPDLLRRNNSSTSKLASVRRKACVKSSEPASDKMHKGDDIHSTRDSSLLDKIFTEKHASVETRRSKYNAASPIEPNYMTFRNLADLSSDFDFRGSFQAPDLVSDDEIYMTMEKTIAPHGDHQRGKTTREKVTNGQSMHAVSTSSESEDSDSDSYISPATAHVTDGTNNTKSSDIFRRYNPGGNTGRLAAGSHVSQKLSVGQCLTLKEEYYTEFLPVFQMFEEFCNLSTPTDKYHKGYQLSQALANIGSRLLGVNNMEMDTMNDLLVVILCNMKVNLAAELYLNTEMMKAFLPPEYDINEYGFMVTFWGGVWTYLLEKLKDMDKDTSAA